MLKLNYLKWVLGVNKRDGNFQLITILIFVLGAFNIYYKFDWTDKGLISETNLWNPSWLLFGPLLYCAFRALVGKPVKMSWGHFWHLLPFLITGCCYLFVTLTTDMKNPWESVYFTWYQNSYLVICLSLLPYSLWVTSKIILVNTRHGANADALIMSIATIFMLISVLIVMMVIGWGIIHADMGVDYRYFSYGLLLFANILIVCYWISTHKYQVKEEITLPEVSKSYRNAPLSPALALTYRQQMTDYFETEQIYLTPNLSLDLLSQELQIPKHHLSQLFNIYLEKSFRQFVADYRISHAIALLNHNNGRLTIETLAHMCGFNSKTSFNRYFKEKTGVTPSEFQLQLGTPYA